jgi:ferritin-like metal-binding protein YciE
MPGQLSNPRDLLLQRLGDILWVERMLAFEVLPQLYRQVQTQSLKRGVEAHLEQTRAHVDRVEQAFRRFEAEPSSNLSPPVAGLQSGHEEIAGQIVEPRLADLFHATAAAHTEHYEIAAYRALVALAGALGDATAVELLRRNLDDEQEMLKELEKIVERLSNELAE